MCSQSSAGTLDDDNEQRDAFVKDPQSYLEARAAQYSVGRYLEKAALELLDIREKDLHANTWTTYSDGRVRAITVPARREFFFTKIIELEAERKLRAGSGDIQFDEAEITRLASAARVEL